MGGRKALVDMPPLEYIHEHESVCLAFSGMLAVSVCKCIYPCVCVCFPLSRAHRARLRWPPLSEHSSPEVTERHGKQEFRQGEITRTRWCYISVARSLMFENEHDYIRCLPLRKSP